MKGGHVGSGSLKDPNALRRDRPGDAAATVHLPAAGRKGRPPVWPLGEPASPEEQVEWLSLWKTPQATEWERLQLYRQVAAYVRVLVRFNQPDAVASYGDQEKTRAEALGLTKFGLSRYGWVIDDGAVAAKVTTAHDPDRASAKARFHAIEGGAAAS